MSEKTYGPLVIISGPSGVGKGTLIHRLMERRKELVFSISYTTRDSRPEERDGVDYFFVTQEDFQARVESGDFLEYAGFADNAYGTSNAYVSAYRSEGRTVLLDIEVQGARQVRARCPEAVLIYIMPPSYEVLKQRLVGRGTEEPEKVRKRLAAAREESRHICEYDYVLVNDELEETVEALDAIFEAIAHRPWDMRQQISRYQQSFPPEGARC